MRGVWATISIRIGGPVQLVVFGLEEDLILIGIERT